MKFRFPCQLIFCGPELSSLLFEGPNVKILGFSSSIFFRPKAVVIGGRPPLVSVSRWLSASKWAGESDLPPRRPRSFTCFSSSFFPCGLRTRNADFPSPLLPPLPQATARMALRLFMIDGRFYPSSLLSPIKIVPLN